MKKCILWLIAIGLSCAICASPASAVLVQLKSGESVFGAFLREDDTKITINAVGADGLKRERTFLKVRDVKNIIYTVDRERLAKLSPDSPSDYRDYAEILAGKKRDPEARDTAIHLYYLAASLDREGLGHSSLLGMILLSRSPEEERRFRSMAYLLDPSHDPSVLIPPKTGRSDDATSEAGTTGLLSAVRHIRSPLKRDRDNQGRVARNFLDKEEVQTELKRFDDIISLEELETAAREGVSNKAQMAQLIRLEMAITGVRGTAKKLEAGSWRAAAAAVGFGPVVQLHWPTLTEFDANRPYFENGKWVSSR